MKKNFNRTNVLALKQLSRKINELIRTGKWSQISEFKRKSLTLSLSSFINKVKTSLSKRRLSRILGAACILISGTSMAQSFGPRQITPFNIDLLEEESFNKPTFGDIDGDGDMDLLTSNYSLGTFLFQENIGSATVPNFAPTESNPFGLITLEEVFFPHFVDMDGDGDLDIMVSNTYGAPSFIENSGTTTAPDFEAPVGTPFGLVDIENSVIIDVVDIDNDGDYDVIHTIYDPVGYTTNISYTENTGTATSPAFGTVVETPFGLDVTGDEYVQMADFVDLDGDGDLDLMRGEFYNASVYYHENIGTATAPLFETGTGIQDPFDIPTAGDEEYFYSASFVDIDADGDFDLFISSYYGQTLFHENLDIDGSDCDATTETEANNVLCFGDNSGNLEVTIVGGTAPYTYDIGDGPVSSGEFSGLVAGEYTVTITDADDCEYNETVTITETAEIAVTTVTVDESLGSDGSIESTITGGTMPYTYAWDGPDGFTSTDQNLSDLNSGVYNLTVTDANGCLFIEPGITVGSTVSIGENEIVFSVYPNPSTGVFTIENKGNELTAVKVTDLTGRVVLNDSKLSNNSFYTIDLSGFDNGTYIIELDIANSKQIKRVVKN